MMPSEHRSHETVQQELKRILQLIQRHRLAEELAQSEQSSRQELVNSVIHKQHVAELERHLDGLHAADIAFLLEALPIQDRLFLWDLVKAERDGDILVEVSDAVRETLIENMDPAELKAAVEQLDADELADLADDLPEQVIEDVYLSMDPAEREQLRAAMSYDEDTVGGLMDFDMVRVRDDVTLEVVLRYLRMFEELPDHTDQLFVVNRKQQLIGTLPIDRLLLNQPEVSVNEVMRTNPITFKPEDDAEEAANAFDRYDLVSAPVVTAGNRLIGRLSIADMVDFMREETESEILQSAGLREGEDLFAPILDSVKNRWAWLAINLVTAFFASRVIGLFEGSIQKLVALAALMPIVAGIGGNSGNQTTTMIVRAMAMDQISLSSAKRLIKKELGVALISGIAWGTVLGIVAYLLYHNAALGAVMMIATTLNLLLAATVGVLIPLLMVRFNRDPAVGSSVLLTACTDSGGFFIFLGLASLLLL